MTSQSRKKHLITAPTSPRVTPPSRGAKVTARPLCRRLLVVLSISCTTAAWNLPAISQDAMRPVPRFSGTSVRDLRTESQKSATATKLQWRTSREVAAATIAPGTANTAVVSPAEGASAAIALTRGQRSESSDVRQAQFQNPSASPADDAGLQLPPGLQTSPAPPAETTKPLPDFFSDPFGEDLPEPPAAPAQQMPAPVPPANNELRTPAPLDELRPPADLLEMPAQPEADQSDAVSPPNPFDDTRSGQPRPADELDEPAMEDFEFQRRPGDQPGAAPSRKYELDEELKRPAEFSCDEFRKSISEDNIQKVSLDISPPFRPDIIELDEFQKLKTKFDEAQSIRDWQSIDGRKLGRGRLRDLAYEKVVIETEHGTVEELPLNRLGEADLAYLSKSWGLPQECLIEQAAYEPRSWQHSKVTWKASNLCHKPLYFEEVNLERYGHTAGPFAQPVISTAHFFANIAVLPYKMGVHAPSECQYALGYYRPGNCAPWIVPPVPISVRGGLYQAAAMTGAFWLIP